MIAKFFEHTFTLVLFLLILTNIQQRKLDAGPKKRMAFLWMSFLYLMTFLFVALTIEWDLPSWTEWPALGLGILLFVVFRKKCFPFRNHCSKCGAKLSFEGWMADDDNLCPECWAKAHPEEAAKKAEAEAKTKKVTDEDKLDSFKDKMKCDEIDWDVWQPYESERCVLTYIKDEENDKMLLIEKLRGMGTGYLNGPGGHIELEETSIEAAVREVKEETGLDVLPEDLEERATLSFQFKDGLRMGGRVYYCNKWSGELIDRSDETIPGWYDADKLDFSRMWADDVLWLPDFLAGRKFDGYFIFDDKKLIDSRIVYRDEEE